MAFSLYYIDLKKEIQQNNKYVKIWEKLKITKEGYDYAMLCTTNI